MYYCWRWWRSSSPWNVGIKNGNTCPWCANSNKIFDGNDSLLSIVQMPKGIPVATFAIGESGATNSALFAISLLSNNDKDIA